MIDPQPPFYVITLGWRYVRYPNIAIVCNNLPQAEKYDTVDEARAARNTLIQRLPEKNKKPIRILRIAVKAV